MDPFLLGTDPFIAGTDPFHVGTDPFSDGMDPFSGGIDPFSGDMDPFLLSATLCAFATPGAPRPCVVGDLLWRSGRRLRYLERRTPPAVQAARGPLTASSVQQHSSTPDV